VIHDDLFGEQFGNALSPGAPTLQHGTCASCTPHPSKEKGCEMGSLAGLSQPKPCTVCKIGEELVLNIGHVS
jgi:hypothetical protein